MQAADVNDSSLTGRLFGYRRHEFSAVAWSFLYFFCLLSSYYVMRPMREAMGVASGPDTIPYLFTGTFIAMLLATPVFGWIASRYPRRRFLPWIYLFFAANILIFYAAFSYMLDRDMSYVWLGRIFFVWISVFNLYVVSVFWSFMADIYTQEQGRRLFGVISAGGSLGAVIGGIVTSNVVTDIGFQNLLPLAAVLLLFAVACISRLRRWVEHEHAGEITETAASDRPLGGNPLAGVTHVLRSKYFIGIAIASAIASILGTALYMFTAQLVEEAISDVNARTSFFSTINYWQNILAVLGQFLLVRHVVQRYGLGISLVLMPLLSIVGFLWLAFDPTLMIVAVFTVLRRALGFAFSKPTSDMLYSVVTPEEKYKAKNFIDTTLYRLGDLIGTWGVRGLSALGIAGISVVMLPLAAIWAMIVLWLGRDYRRRDQLNNEGPEHDE